MRDGFIIHEKTLQQLGLMEPEDRGYLISCMSDYYYTGSIDINEVYKVSPIVAVALIDATERMDADAQAYNDSAERRVNSAKKAAAARWSKDKEQDTENANASERNANASNRICESDAENAVSVSVPVPVSVEKKKRVVRSAPPTLEEVTEYCKERANSIDPEAFIAYYESQNWKKANGQPVYDWKGCIRTWEKREKTKPAREPPKPKAAYFDVPQRSYDYAALERQILGGNR